MTLNKELKLLYKTIAEQIEIAKENCQQVLMIVDFNVKVGNHMLGNNKKTVSKGGRQLKRIIEQREERSIIDYVITSQEYMETIKRMEIDEEKQCGLDKIECQNKRIKKHTLTTMLF